MSENNLPNIEGEENVTPVAEETAEVVEEATETIEEVVEDVQDAAETAEDVFEVTENVDELSQEDIEYVTQQVEEIVAKKSGVGKVVAIIIVIVAVLAAVGFGAFKYLTKNPYNEMGYINVSGRTVADVAADAGMELDEFLATYGLPADMPEDTDESAAYYNIPVSMIAQMYGMDTAGIKEMLGLGDDVTDTTPWGEAEGKATLAKYIGEENIDAFKAEYGLGDDVTGETPWGEIRNTVDAKTLEMRKAAEEGTADTDVDANTAEDADAPEEGETDGEQTAE